MKEQSNLPPFRGAIATQLQASALNDVQHCKAAGIPHSLDIPGEALHHDEHSTRAILTRSYKATIDASMPQADSKHQGPQPHLLPNIPATGAIKARRCL